MRRFTAEETAERPLPKTFTLLCWNVHKEMGQPRFLETFGRLLERYAPELLLLQEAVLDAATVGRLEGYSFAVSVNIGMKKRSYGVLTAGRCRFDDIVGIKTLRREMHVTTRKSLLITTHPFADGETLTVVNLHAINFVSAAVFAEETERLREKIASVEGPLVVTGDFNTWSGKRMHHLERFAAAVGLKKAALEDDHHVKRLFSKPLDHLFYRGLKLTMARAVDTGRVSDHNPIVAAFSLPGGQ